MADELDPRMEARLRETLRHEADSLPFVLTLADLEAARRRRHAPMARLRMPAAMLASAAAVVIVVAGLVAWRGASLPPTGTDPASPNPLASELKTYEELAAGIGIINGQVIGQGEELSGAPDGGEVVIGTIPATGYLDYVVDCRGGDIQVGVRLGDTPGGSVGTRCDDAVTTTFSTPGFGVDGATVWVKADPGTVWRMVVGGDRASQTAAPQQASSSLEPASSATGLSSFEELAASALSTHEVARAEGAAEATATEVEIMQLADLWNLEVAVSCVGDGEITIANTGSESTSTHTIGCSAGETRAGSTFMTLLDPAAERPGDSALVATVPAGVAWRLIVFDRGADIANGPVMPEAASPATVLTAFDSKLTPTEPFAEQAGPVPADATIEVAFGCSTGAFTPTDPPTLLRVTVDGVTSELACLKDIVAHFVPAGGVVELGLATDRAVDLALEVRAFTQEQAGTAVVVPSALLRAASVMSSAEGFTDCLAAYAVPGGASAEDGCSRRPLAVPEARAVRVPAGDVLELVPLDGWEMTGATITYLPSSAAGNATPGEPIRHPDPDGPGAEGGFTIEPFPVGDWTVRVPLSGRLADGTTFTSEQLFRVIVGP